MSCAPCVKVLEDVMVLLKMLNSDHVTAEARFQARKVAIEAKVAMDFINDKELEEWREK